MRPHTPSNRLLDLTDVLTKIIKRVAFVTVKTVRDLVRALVVEGHEPRLRECRRKVRFPAPFPREKTEVKVHRRTTTGSVKLAAHHTFSAAAAAGGQISTCSRARCHPGVIPTRN